MAPASIVKIAVSAFVVAAACGTALVVAVNREARLGTGTIAAIIDASQPAPGVPTAASSVPAAAETKETREIKESKEAEETKAIKETKPATAVAPTLELAGQPEIAAADQSAPSFDLARIEENGDAVLAGRAAPGATVDLLRDGERLDRTVADASGDFVMVSRLPAGNYELSLSAKLPDGKVAFSKKGVTVEVDNTASGSGSSSGAAQSRAEYIPESAPQARLPSQSPVPDSKPQQRAALKPAHVDAGNSAPEETVSSTAISSRNVMRVTRGDSLWRISRITYGDGARYAVVYRANRDRIQDPNLIHPGQILVLPTRQR
jgi:nucleoid-associated protein YgaU